MPAQETPSNTQPHKRPWGWIALAGLLTAGVVALAIYAVNLNSDLDEANATIAAQQKEIDKAQGTVPGPRPPRRWPMRAERELGAAKADGVRRWTGVAAARRR